MVVVTSLGPPEEGIHHKEEGTTTYINEKNIGKGTLYVSESIRSTLATTISKLANPSACQELLFRNIKY